MNSTSSSEILWKEILCRIPFIKEYSKEEDLKIRIDSKNEVEEEDALQLEAEILNQEVILSHSIPWPPQLHSKGFVEEFKYEKKSIQVTVSSPDGFSIWEDTDIWMYSLSTPTSSFNDPPTTSTSNPPESPLKKPSEMTQSEIFESINGWMLLSQRRQRKRQKYGEKWKNVYLTELEMTCVDPKNQGFLEFIEVGTSLRFGDNIDEVGDVLVDVLRKNKNSTITFGVTGFTSSKVDILLSKESTYYLRIYDEEDDEDMESIISEDYILPGYPLEQNLDELCEKIGQLTITDLCVKTWLTPIRNTPYIRLSVTSRRQMINFKLLTGHYVTIQSTVQNSRQTVLAVVNRVLKDEMILTLKGVPKGQWKHFFFSKTERITIQIDHNYEERIQKSHLEKLRWEFINGEKDIKLFRKWKDEKKIYFASFATKNEAFSRIPNNTVVLLGKCWETEKLLEHKADFLIGVRVDNSICKFTAQNMNQVTFEIKNYRNQLEESVHFDLSQAFYYVDFASLTDVLKSSIYTPINIRNHGEPTRPMTSPLCNISKNLKFFVYPQEPTVTQQKPESKQKPKKKGGMKMKKIEEEVIPEDPKMIETPPPLPLRLPRDIHLEKRALHRMIDSKEPFEVLSQIDERHRRLCYVYIKSLCQDRDFNIIELDTNVIGEKGKSLNHPSLKLNLGLNILMTGGDDEKEIRLKGEVFDTRQIPGNHLSQNGSKIDGYQFHSNGFIEKSSVISDLCGEEEHKV